MKIGDEVSWIGGADFGRREVTWTGIVLSIHAGVPRAYDEQGCEIYPRLPAALVHTIVPQHDLKEHWPGETIEIAIELTKLLVVEECRDERSEMISDFVTMHERKAIVCGCRTCRRQSQARCGGCDFVKIVNLMNPTRFSASEGWRWLCAACEVLEKHGHISKEKTR